MVLVVRAGWPLRVVRAGDSGEAAGGGRLHAVGGVYRREVGEEEGD